MIRDLKQVFGKKSSDKASIEKYTRMLRESSGDKPDIHLKLGKLYEKAGQKAKAIQEYTVSAKLFAKHEEIAKAIAVNTLIVGLDANNRDALANLAFLQFQHSEELSEEEVDSVVDEIAVPQQAGPDASKPDTKRWKWFDEDSEKLEGIQGYTEEQQPVESAQAPSQEEETVSAEVSKSKIDSAAVVEVSIQDKVSDSGTKTLEGPESQTSEESSENSQFEIFPFVLPEIQHSDLQELKKHIQLHTLAEHETILRRSTNTQSLFVIFEGQVQISLRGPESEQEFSLGSLGPGDFFGENSLWHYCDFCLTATTDTPCTIVEISKASLVPFVKKYPQILDILKKAYKRRWFFPVLANTPLFARLPMEEQQKIAEYLFPIEKKKGSVIIAEGECDESIYLIQSGEVGVRTKLNERDELQVVRSSQEQLYLATLKDGDFFGEGAFLTKEPRSATISALTDVRLFKLPKQYLQHVIEDYPQVGILLEKLHSQRASNTMKTMMNVLFSEDEKH